MILSGGLTPANVSDAIATVHPFAVDVASGVELEPGRKDPEKLEAFAAAVRADATTGAPAG
jgi:phosphoribosylanthranilate isomerase